MYRDIRRLFYSSVKRIKQTSCVTLAFIRDLSIFINSKINRKINYTDVLQIMNDRQRLLEHLEQVESKAGEILTDRQEIVALDKRRNDDRVGMRALQRQSCEKTWITVGPLLLKMPSKAAEELLEKGNSL